MTEMPIYLAGLLVAVAALLITGCKMPGCRAQLWRVAAAVGLNWLAGLTYVEISGDFTPWKFSIVADIAAAAAVMWHPAGRAQCYIGIFYFLQIAGHIGFGARSILGYDPDPVYYYDAITWVAWGQLAAIGAWTGGLWIGHIVHSHRDSRDAVDSLARHGRIREG